jgi:Ca2+-binding RTX toxin-like protein
MKSTALRRLTAGPLFGLAAVLVHPDIALAAVTGLEANVTGGVLTVTSGGNLADKITVLGPLTASDGTFIAVVSDAEQIVPGTGCEAVDRYRVACDARAITRIDVSTGAGDDRVVVDAASAVAVPRRAAVSGGAALPVTVSGDGALPAAAAVAGGAVLPVVVHGGDGNDQLTDRAGSNELFGDAGSDWLYGGAGDDRLHGGDGTDQIYGEAGNDTTEGGEGTDFFVAGFGDDGTDVVRGGDGIDYADYSRRSTPVTVTLDGVADDGAAGENDALAADVESVRGGGGDDHLTGNGEANTLDGGAGNDRIAGLGGDDSLYGDRGDDSVDGGAGADSLAGGPGRDTVRGGGGNDSLSVGEHTGEGIDIDPDLYDGGAGDDRLSYSWTSRAVTVSLDGVANDGKAGENDNAVAIENISGTNHDDVLIGDSGDNRITGEAGNDVIDGGAGIDDLNGGPGQDTLRSVDGVGSRDRVEGGYPWDMAKDGDTCEADADDLVFACANEVISQR